MSPDELSEIVAEYEQSGGLMDFCRDVVSDDALLALFSYWAKWFTSPQRSIFEQAVCQFRQAQSTEAEALPLSLHSKFSQEQLQILFINLQAIQLSYGCSKGCPFCELDAVLGVIEHLPYQLLRNMYDAYWKCLSIAQPSFYWANELGDYPGYEAVHQLAVEYACYTPMITTNHKGDIEWLKFVQSEQVLGGRVSVYGMSEEELKELEGKGVSPDNMTGRGVNHVRGHGVSFRVYDQPIKNTGAMGEGVLLTPRGIYNIMLVPVSEQYPQGLVVLPISQVGGPELEVGNSIIDALLDGAVMEYQMVRDQIGQTFKIYSAVYSKGQHLAVAIDENFRITKIKPLTQNVRLSTSISWLKKTYKELKKRKGYSAKADRFVEICSIRSEMFEANTVTNGYLGNFSDLFFGFYPDSPVLVRTGFLVFVVDDLTIVLFPSSEKVNNIVSTWPDGQSVKLSKVSSLLGDEPVRLSRQTLFLNHCVFCGSENPEQSDWLEKLKELRLNSSEN